MRKVTVLEEKHPSGWPKTITLRSIKTLFVSINVGLDPHGSSSQLTFTIGDLNSPRNVNISVNEPLVCYIIEHVSKAHRTIQGKDYRAKPTTQQHIPMRNTTLAKRRTAQATAQTLNSPIAGPPDYATISRRVTESRH
jgi:hypothetical protein